MYIYIYNDNNKQHNIGRGARAALRPRGRARPVDIIDAHMATANIDILIAIVYQHHQLSSSHYDLRFARPLSIVIICQRYTLIISIITSTLTSVHQLYIYIYTS